MVSPASAVVSKTLSQSDFSNAYHTIKTGMDIDLLQLMGRWQDIGYEVESTVEVPGTMSRRGGIVDIFPVYHEQPARIEFFGNTIESIRLFDPKTQRSTGLVNSIIVTPAKENYLHSNSTVLDYLPDKLLLIVDDLNEIGAVIDTSMSNMPSSNRQAMSRLRQYRIQVLAYSPAMNSRRTLARYIGNCFSAHGISRVPMRCSFSLCRYRHCQNTVAGWKCFLENYSKSFRRSAE